MLPLLIGAGLTLAGGIMKQGAVNRLEGERKERIALQDADILEARETPQITTARGNLTALVEDAEKAGFNPLSVLRSGGLGAYTTTRHPNLFPIRGIDTAATGQSPFGDALGGIGGMVSGYDYGASARNAAELQLMSAQMQNVQADTLARQSFRVPSVSYGGTPGGYSTTPGGAGQSRPLGMPSQSDWSEEVPGLTNPYGGDWIHMNPNWSDIGSGAEEAYGEIGGTLFAPFKWGADVGYNLARGVEHITGVDPRDWGPAALQTVGSWWSQANNGNQPVTQPPLSIVVGGPNQTGL